MFPILVVWVDLEMLASVQVLIHFLHCYSYILSCFVFHVVLVIAVGCAVAKCRMSHDHLLVMNTRVERLACLQWCLGAIVANCKYNCHKTMFYNMHITKILWQWYGVP
jgi:hypothetical protein